MKSTRRKVDRSIVEQQLDRVINSAEFLRSSGSTRLLRYLVENTLSESSHLLKEYVVGVEVFGKSADFDTRYNSVVRVEATRLRKKLRIYYYSDGAQDPVLITLPRGGYQVQVELRENPAPGRNGAADTRTFDERAPSLAIQPPKTFQVPPREVELLVDAIWRSLHLSAGVEVHAPPRVPSKKTIRREHRVSERATFMLDLTVRRSGEDGPRMVSVSIQTLQGETICYVTHSAADLTQCGYLIAHEVLGLLQLSPAASFWYDLGRHLLKQLTPTALRNSRACFEQALLANGRDPRVHSALALACALLYIFDAGDPAALVMRVSETAPQGIGSECGVDSHLALAVIAWGYHGDWHEAERRLNIAKKLSQGSPVVRFWHALFLASAGSTEEAVKELIQAYDPKAFSVASELALGCAFWLRGEYRAAAARIRWVLATEPQNAIAHLLLGWILLADSRPQQAMEPLEMAKTLSGAGTLATAALGFAAARSGHGGLARDILQDLLRTADGTSELDVAAGIIHLALGEETEAQQRFHQAQAKRSGRLGMLHFTPEFGTVRPLWLTSLSGRLQATLPDNSSLVSLVLGIPIARKQDDPAGFPER